MRKIQFDHCRISRYQRPIAVRTGTMRKIPGIRHDPQHHRGWGSFPLVPLDFGLTIIGMLGFGWWMNHFPARADQFFYRSIHADIGYLVLLLGVLRLLWRCVNPTPAMPAETSLAADRGPCQPWRALCRRDPGRDAGLGAFRSPHPIIRTSWPVPRAAIHTRRTRRRRRPTRPPHPLCLCAARLDRGSRDRRPLAPLDPPRPRRGADGDGRGGG